MSCPDKVSQYLSSLQTGYQVTSIVWQSPASNMKEIIVPPNPNRIFLFLSFLHAGAEYYGFELPDGVFVPFWSVGPPFLFFTTAYEYSSPTFGVITDNSIDPGAKIFGYSICKQ